MPIALTTKTSSQVRFWFNLSLTFAVIYGLLGLREAFSGEYVVQDDARQHVFWMQRFLDSALFPKDLIADYFQSVAPAGYTAIYQMMAGRGINPLLVNKLLPTVLGLITTGYCFGVCLELLPVPTAGFIATLLLNQSLWMKDDLVSATPRAFVYPLFLAFLYYLLRRSLLPVCVAIALLGWFYPHFVLIAAIILILRLLRWDRGLPRLSRNRSDYLFCAIGLGVALLVMLPFALEASEFGPTITAAEARKLPEFLPGGRSAFFYNDPWRFWLSASRSGLLPSIKPPLLAVGFLLPVLLRYPSLFPLAQRVNSIAILPQVVVASLLMFFAAHALLFKLHLPNRYSEHSLRIVLAIAAGITLIVICNALWHTCKQRLPYFQGRQILALASVVLIGAALILYPSFEKNFPNTKYQVGNFPLLYQFFQEQPKDSLIASLSGEADNLPTFSQRSILVGREYAIPYHLGYYRQFRQRMLALIRAQYNPDLTAVQTLIQKYGVDFWLLDREAFTPEYIANNSWIKQYQPASAEALTSLQQGIPALSAVMGRCSVFETQGLVVLNAACIVQEEALLAGRGEQGRRIHVELETPHDSMHPT